MASNISPEGYVYRFALQDGLARRRPTPIDASKLEEIVSRQSFTPVNAATVGEMSSQELKYVARLITDAIAEVLGDTI